MFEFLKRNKATIAQQNEDVEERNLSAFQGAFNFNGKSSYNSKYPTRLSAVFACVNTISNSIATLPLNIFNVDSEGFNNAIYNHPALKLLNKQPSKNISKFNFFKQLTTNILLSGNAYALLVRDSKGELTSIKYIKPEDVIVYYNEVTDTLTYVVKGYKDKIASKDILHFWLYSDNNLVGISTLKYAERTLRSSSDAENHSANTFKSGSLSTGFLKSMLNLNPQQKTQAQTSWNAAFNTDAGNGIAILPNGFEFQSISVNPRESQLLESRNYNLSEICRFFNCPPQMIYDYSKSSYSTLEQVNLIYLQQTLNPILECIENEFNRKIFIDNELTTLSIEFDRSELKNTDKANTSQYYTSLFTNGLITQNEARKALNMDNVEGGDNLFIQLNMTTTERVINGTAQQDKIQQKVK
jgi:HK97 family phage portal protein